MLLQKGSSGFGLLIIIFMLSLIFPMTARTQLLPNQYIPVGAGYYGIQSPLGATSLAAQNVGLGSYAPYQYAQNPYQFQTGADMYARLQETTYARNLYQSHIDTGIPAFVLENGYARNPYQLQTPYAQNQYQVQSQYAQNPYLTQSQYAQNPYQLQTQYAQTQYRLPAQYTRNQYQVQNQYAQNPYQLPAQYAQNQYLTQNQYAQNQYQLPAQYAQNQYLQYLAQTQYTQNPYQITYNPAQIIYNPVQTQPQPPTNQQIPTVDQAFDEGSDGDYATIAEGDKIGIVLNSSPSSGYHWILDTVVLDDAIVKKVSSQFYSGSSAGVVSKELWVFEGEDIGTASIEMEYLDAYGNTINTFKLTVEVE